MLEEAFRPCLVGFDPFPQIGRQLPQMSRLIGFVLQPLPQQATLFLESFGGFSTRVGEMGAD